MKTLFLLSLLAVIFILADAHSRWSWEKKHWNRRYRYRCCRRRFDYGGCHNHVRRWAYNVTCGKCVPFDYSGCGGDENNFSCLEECEGCCHGTTACPKYTLPKPPYGCEYKWHDGPDDCPRPRLQCTCLKQTCSHNSCRIGQRCIPQSVSCDKCPCQQYQCVTDPCYALGQLRPCEKCISVPAPTCHHRPCPLIPHIENHCPPPTTTTTTEAPTEPPPQCHHYYPCPPSGNPCQFRKCYRYPHAQCVVDPCDCRQCNWYVHGHRYSDADCIFGRRK